MAIFFNITLFTLLGFIMTPTRTYACEPKSEKIENTCCKKSDSGIKKECCCNTNNRQCDKHVKNCDDNCENPNCCCQTIYKYFLISSFYEFLEINKIDSKPNFYYQDTYYLFGSLSIWLPPKIG